MAARSLSPLSSGSSPHPCTTSAVSLRHRHSLRLLCSRAEAQPARLSGPRRFICPRCSSGRPAGPDTAGPMDFKVRPRTRMEPLEASPSASGLAGGPEAEAGPGRISPAEDGSKSLLWPPSQGEAEASRAVADPGEAESRTGSAGAEQGASGAPAAAPARDSGSTSSSRSSSNGGAVPSDWLMVRGSSADVRRPRQRLVQTPKRRPLQRLPRNVWEDLWHHLQLRMGTPQGRRGGPPPHGDGVPKWRVQTAKPRSVTETAAAVAASGTAISLCVVCTGKGRVACEKCWGRGRTNCTSHAVLSKGVWPKWCWFCRGSGLMYCARCLGTGEKRGVIGFHVLDRDTLP